MGGQRITEKLAQKWRTSCTSRLGRTIVPSLQVPYRLTASHRVTQRSSAKGNGGQRDLVLTRVTIWCMGIVLSKYHIYADDWLRRDCLPRLKFRPPPNQLNGL